MHSASFGTTEADTQRGSGSAGLLTLAGTQLQFQHDKPFIVLYGYDGLMIFGAQGTFDLLGFRPEIKQLLIRQVFDLNIERRFIGGSETSGHTCSLSEAEARKRPVPTTICALSVLTDYKDKWGEWQASLRKSPAPLGRRTEMQAQDGPLFC